jgi:hypothetical protein
MSKICVSGGTETILGIAEQKNWSAVGPWRIREKEWNPLVWASDQTTALWGMVMALL